MFIISTRNFPPDIGGIQNLMEGLAKAMVSHGPVKVFADIFPDSERYDKNSNIEIERVSGFKIFRKYRKANLIHEFLRKNNARAIFFDHWKSLENINEENIKNTPSFCLIHSKEINHPKGSMLNKRVLNSIQKTKCAVTAEEHQKLGGLGGSIAQLLSEKMPSPLEMIAVNDQFGESGKPSLLMKKYKLDAENIIKACEKVLQRK